jgi:hypothetical protein
MESQPMFLDCPAYLDEQGIARCGLPAEVINRFTMRSTDGLLESATIRCPVGHLFRGPVEFLSLADKRAGQAAPRPVNRPR